MAKTTNAKNLFAEKVAARKKLNEGKTMGFDDVEFEDGIRDTYGVDDNYEDENDSEFLRSYGLTSYNDDEIEDAIRGEDLDAEFDAANEDEFDAVAFDDESDELQAEEDRYFEALSKKEKKLEEALTAIRAKKAALREMKLGFQVLNPKGVPVDEFGRTSGTPKMYNTKKEAEEAAKKFSAKKGADFTVEEAA